MEGVQILNQFEVVTETVFNWSAFWTGVGIGVVIGLIAAIIFGCSESDWLAFFVGCAVYIPLISLLLGGLSGAFLVRKPIAWETHYEVSINEEVNMQDFMDKYEIVETRGEIYTVREK
jgi:hypothetical protein